MLERFLGAMGLSLGPLLLAVSTFYWDDGRYGVIGGTLEAVAVMLWFLGLISVYLDMGRTLPRTSVVLAFVAAAGAMAGIGFGYQGFFETAFGIDAEAGIDQVMQYPVAAGILLFWTGPLFPLAVAGTGVTLGVRRLTAGWVAAMVVIGGLAFPLSRVTRTEWIAHLADVLVLIPFLYLAVQAGRTGYPLRPHQTGRRRPPRV